VLLAYGAISTLFNTITFLFGPGETGSTFSQRAVGTTNVLLNPVVIGGLVGAVVLAHVISHLKLAKIISLVALVSIGVAALFGVVALFSAFGADSMVTTGWGKTVNFFVGIAELGVAGVAGWLVLGYFQQHGPATPAQPQFNQPPQGQWNQQPQQQWQPPQTNAPAPQPWGPPPAGQQQPQAPQQWGPPPQQGAPQGGGFGGQSDSMATQAIPAVPPAHQQQPPQQQAAPETQQFPPVGNWTSEG
jgi:hypothetical protein